MIPITDVAPSPTNPWISIWTRPRATMRSILDTDPRRHVLLLALLGGVAGRLEPGSSATVLLVSAVIGLLTGLLVWAVGGWILRWTGSLLGGQATVEETRAALAWSQVPLICWAVLSWAIYLVVAGAEMFTGETGPMDTGPGSAVLLPLSVIEIIVTMWAAVVSFKCMGEAHRFSAWRALGAGLISCAIFVPFLCVLGAAG